MRLAGKAAIITGSGRGIGAALARRFARAYSRARRTGALAIPLLYAGNSTKWLAGIEFMDGDMHRDPWREERFGY